METGDVGSLKRRRLDSHVGDKRGERKRKPGDDEFKMLGLEPDCNTSDTREDSDLEGFRIGCGSSMRSG